MRIKRISMKLIGKRPLLFILCSLFFSPAGAQNGVLRMADVFKQMPDSLLPYLTTNNRLDMIDFMEARMKAEVTNLLDGHSEMTVLTDDSLSIRMSHSLQVDLRFVERDSTVIAYRKIYTVSDTQQMVVTRYYSTSWLPLPIPEETSSSLIRRDEEVFSDGARASRSQ